MNTTIASPSVHFEVPAERWATTPPESRGIARDQVRMLVARPDGVDHVRFADLGWFLSEGDVLVVNTSATVPAAIDATLDGAPVVVHVAGPHPHGDSVIELRHPDGRGPVTDARGRRSAVGLVGGSIRLLEPAASGPGGLGVRLWRARFHTYPRLDEYLRIHGRPITYGANTDRLPIESYQTVFALHNGSAEMPSAARPFSTDLVVSLVAAGVMIAPVTLHAGVSSQTAGEPPQPERFAVPAATADLVNLARDRGGRIVAVGTTSTRAVESATDEDGVVHAAQGWTDLVVTPERGVRVVGGLISGWHEADASHLLLLEAVAGVDLVQQAYDGAVGNGYLWHGFGDSALFLPQVQGS